MGIPLDAIVLLSVGEVNANKNHKVVIEALPDLRECWFVLCGYGQLMKDHRELAESLRVSDRFIMTGYRTDVIEFYNMADVFVFPSFREGLPVALMEAMAAGLPCVAARNRGTDDLMGGSKLRFDPGSRNNLISCLNTAMHVDQTIEIEQNFTKLGRFDIANTVEIVKKLYIDSINA